jgi:hypothetical protein
MEEEIFIAEKVGHFAGEGEETYNPQSRYQVLGRYSNRKLSEFESHASSLYYGAQCVQQSYQ